MASGILEIPQQRERKTEEGEGDVAYCIACNRLHSVALS